MKARRPLLILPLALGLSLATVGADTASAPRFSHQQHLEDASAECVSCHVDSEPAEPLPVLDRRYCIECHDEAPTYRIEQRARRLAIAFPHRAHAQQDCVTCHAAVIKESAEGGMPMVTRVGCVDCHEDKGVKVADSHCAACHGEDARKTAPVDHNMGWLLRHGREASWRVHEDHGSSCQDCHARDACRACHRERRPRDHNALWRVRVHGTAASWDRERCKTCHETGTCDRCHRSTAPVSHRGSWRSQHGRAVAGIDNNCTICHQPGWCTSCHSGGRR